ncbi:ATP-dependent DNA helicase PcrA [Chlamydia trachomatis]|nr:ATP-dependent DNA helicase PcrA [Chlamydia trachomatis]
MVHMPLVWDFSQEQVMASCVPGAILSVYGAPGSGKTEILQECVRRAIIRNPQAKIAVLSPDRRAAGALRNSLSRKIGGLGENVVVQSITAYAFSVVSLYAQREGRRSPVLISGADQDAILKDIFDVATSGYLAGINDEALEECHISMQTTQLPAFRSEMRDLITRAAELCICADRLASLGELYTQPVWKLGAAVMNHYEQALATQAASSRDNPDRLDHSRVVNQAAEVLMQWAGSEETENSGGIAVEKPQWDFVFVDDVHNATLALPKLLQAVIADGAAVVCFGNPDQGVQGYRGGISKMLRILEKSAADGGIGAQPLFLASVYGYTPQLVACQQKICEAIAPGGAAFHRDVTVHCAVQSRENADRPAREQEQNAPAENDSPVIAYTFTNETEELAFIAQRILELHAEHGVPFSDIAVVTRARGAHNEMRASLIRYGIPVEAQASALPLRDQAVIVSFMALLHLALGDSEYCTGENARAVLTGAIRGVDSLTLRAMARRIVAAAAENEQYLNEYGVWELFAQNPLNALFESEPDMQPFIRAIRSVRKNVKADKPASHVLWGLWKELNVAQKWREVALRNGTEADQANAYLDSMIQFFRVAQRLYDQDPHKADIRTFIEHIEHQDLPEDTIAAVGADRDAIALLTPAATVGRSWRHIVVADMNEGVWPDVRLRNPISKVPELVGTIVDSILAGQAVPPSQLRAEVVADELRMLVQTVSRARESVTFTCIDSADMMPSRFIAWLTSEASSQLQTGNTERGSEHSFESSVCELVPVEHTVDVLSMESLIGDLRKARVLGGEYARYANDQLERLVEAGIKTADPRWWADEMSVTYWAESMRDSSQDTQLLQCAHKDRRKKEKIEKKKAVISPSKVESMLQCPLKGFLQGIGAEDSDSTSAQKLGTLIHKIAQDHPQGGIDDMKKELEQLWEQEMGLVSGNLESDREFTKALGMLDKLDKYCACASKDVDVEKYARYESQVWSVSAKLDRLEFSDRDSGHVIVADIKTGSAITKEEAEVNPQLLIYQWLVNQQAVRELKIPDGVDAVSAGAQLVFVGKQESTHAQIRSQLPLDSDKEKYVLRMLDTAAELLSRQDFLARANKNCDSCSFMPLCPAHEGERLFS